MTEPRVRRSARGRVRRANGEGSIYQRKDGRWEAAVYVVTPTGSRVRKRVYGATHAEAHVKLTELVSRTQQGLPVTPRGQLLGPFLEHYLSTVAVGKVRPSTYRAYETYVRLHLVPGLGRKRLDRLSPGEVRAFLDGRRAAGLAPRTVQQLHAILRVALQHALREDLVPRNVAKLVSVPAGRRREVQPLDPGEARKLLDEARLDRLYALYAVALGVGLRRGEALGLAWSDVDVEAGVLRVRQTLQRFDGRLQLVPPKTQRSRRTVPLPALCLAALREHRVRQAQERLAAGPYWQDTGLVFTTSIGTPVEPRNLTRDFSLLCQRAGVRRVRLHDLRHTCASLLLAQGVAPRVVMETLGHSGIGITMDTYAHVLPVVQREAAARMDALLGG